MSNKKKATKGDKTQGLSEFINSYLDIPPDILPNECCITLRGRNFLSVGKCRKILLYTPTEIRLSLYKGTLCVKGKRLVCISYHRDGTEIDGVIDSVSFEEEEKEEVQ